MLDQFQRRGFATEAMGALIDWAFSHDEVRIIRARVLASQEQSIRVLEKSGLSFIGEGGQPRVLRFERVAAAAPVAASCRGVHAEPPIRAGAATKQVAEPHLDRRQPL